MGFFNLLSWRVTTEKDDGKKTFSWATMTLEVNGKKQVSAAEGIGPVNALHQVFYKCLENSFSCIYEVSLSDYTVATVEKMGSASRVEVRVEYADRNEVWSSRKVSGDVIEASWLALAECVEYKLSKEYLVCLMAMIMAFRSAQATTKRMKEGSYEKGKEERDAEEKNRKGRFGSVLVLVNSCQPG